MPRVACRARASASSPRLAASALPWFKFFIIIVTLFPATVLAVSCTIPGWSATAEAAVSGATQVSAGTAAAHFSSGPDPYPNNQECFKAFSGHPFLRVNFSDFETERRWDTLSVFDGPNETSQALARDASGSSVPCALTTSQDVLLLKFET